MELSYTDLLIGNVLLQLPDVPFGFSQKRTGGLLHLVAAIKLKISGKTCVAVGVSPTCKQDISHAIHGIHDSATHVMSADVPYTFIGRSGVVTLFYLFLALWFHIRRK